MKKRLRKKLRKRWMEFFEKMPLIDAIGHDLLAMFVGRHP